MKHRNRLLMSGLLALTMGLGVSSTAFAYQDELSRKSPNYNASFVLEMNKVLTSQDYGAWKELVEDNIGVVDEVITADKFEKFTEAWKLANQGKIKEANAIRKALEQEAKMV
jgi:hypothetical protein